MKSHIKAQLFIVITGLSFLGIGVHMRQLALKLIGAVFLLVWWWMYLREDHLQAVTGYTKKKWSERSLLRHIRRHEEKYLQVQPYIQRFAVAFNVLLPFEWELTEDDTLQVVKTSQVAMDGTNKEEGPLAYEKNRLPALLLDLKELLRLQGVSIEDLDVLILWINRAVHQHRCERLTGKLLEQMPKSFSVEDVIHRYIDLIGDVRPEDYGVRPLYCQTRYLAQFLLQHFDDFEIAESIRQKQVPRERQRLEHLLETIVQEQLGDVIRAKRVQVLRDVLISKKPPAIPKTIETFDGLDQDAFIKEVFLMFTHAGYRVSDMTQDGQGADAVLEKLGERIVLRTQPLSIGQEVPLMVVQQTHAARAFYEADRAWIVTNRQFADAAISLASRVGIQLFDRSQMSRLIKRFYLVDADYVSLLFGRSDDTFVLDRQETKRWNLVHEK
ncbi:restriction endonuclease [Fodinisporobacter ferrooxydans]|uniref:Restriction endonuclease n=1 Tax=Fodinisporobacter ferrooxydans TaxID=2901836 RepID=A0ABY4CHC9_9BACL|nr:restriction endonuclease [Alicyclobacillaceae bacterium MYW30-H2]